MSTQKDKFENEESFIVQNITRGPHFVTDINLQFGPLEVMDLSWEENPDLIKKSKDLRTSLSKGYLKRITQAQFDKHIEQVAEKEKKELYRQQQQEQTSRKVKVGDKTILADSFDASKGNSRKASAESSLGLANEPLAYAEALSIAQSNAELHGDELSASEFAEMVDGDPMLVSKLLSSQNGSESGRPRTAQAYYAEAPSSFDTSSIIKQAQNKRSVRRDVEFVDRVIPDEYHFDNFADDDELGYDEAEETFGEEIDLSKEIR